MSLLITSTHRRVLLRLAFAAAISGLKLVLVVPILVPVSLLIDRIFDGKWPQYDFKFIVMITSILGGGLFAFHLVANFSEYIANERLGEKTSQVFPGKIWVEMLCISVVALALLAIWGTTKEGDPLAYRCAPIAFVVLAWYLWPRTIHLTNYSVWQRRQFGAKLVIPYNDVESIVFDPKQGAIIVNSLDGSRIAHSVHRNADMFQRELENRTGKKVGI